MTGGAPDAAHDSSWQIGEIIFGIPFVIALALGFAIPLEFPTGFPPSFTTAFGIALILAGITLIVLARREFRRFAQPTDPCQPTSAIVTTGVFAISRNPIYLGAAFFLAGIGFMTRQPWVLIFFLPSLAACHFLLIAPEEKYLAARFPAEYGRYASIVHRWFGRRRPRSAQRC